MCEERKYRLAILASHPIHYQIGIFRAVLQNPKAEGTVYFCSDFGIREGFDKTFGKSITWYDQSLLYGLPHKFLRNYSLRPAIDDFFSEINPGIIGELLLKRYDAVLVFGYTFFSNWLAFLGARFAGIPVLFRGETDLLSPRSFLKRMIKRAILTPLFWRIKAFLYSCSNNAEYYKHYGVSEDKLFFCPCAVDNEFLQGEACKLKGRKWELKKRLGLSDRKPLIIFVGKLIGLKRPMDLLKAYEVLRIYREVSLLFVGDGPEAQNLKDYVQTKKIEDVYFAGFQYPKDLPAYYSIADLFVLPSGFDRSPKTINEAMNFSLPIISTNGVGTAPDLIKNGENGFIYPVGNIEALKNCILKVIEDRQTLSRMGKRSREIVSGWSFTQDAEGILFALDYVVNR